MSSAPPPCGTRLSLIPRERNAFQFGVRQLAQGCTNPPGPEGRALEGGEGGPYVLGMSYRDDLEHAHRRIERLESELREARIVRPAPPRPGPQLLVAIASALTLFAIGVGAIAVTLKGSSAREDGVAW